MQRMRNRRRLLIGVGAGIVSLGIAAFAGWWFVLRSDSPPPVDLASAVEAATATTQAASVPETTLAAVEENDAPPTTTAPAATSPAAGTEGITGVWAVPAGSDSFVGYRVKEELAQIGFTEAVGRTSEIEASMEIEDTTIVDVSVLVDMATLRSDNSNRDNQMRTQALETNEFPTAEFRLTDPIELGEAPAEGVGITAAATGELTIHGVTNVVDVPIEAQLAGDTIVVVASIPVLFADYDIDPPTSLRLLSVEDNGTIEMQLLFTRG